MLQAIRDLLNALGNTDQGVECVLNHQAFQAISDLLRSTFGENAAHKFEQACTSHGSGISYTLSLEEFGDDLWE